MSEPKDQAGGRNFLETISRAVADFRGYPDKQARRESDQRVRRWLADRLDGSRQAIESLAGPLADAGQIDILPQMERLRARLDKLTARIRGATEPYNGFFDPARIQDDLVDRVYRQDAALIEGVDAVEKAIQRLPGEHDRIAAALPGLRQQIDGLETQWGEREALLKGVK